jgi:hypothetical protein
VQTFNLPGHQDPYLLPVIVPEHREAGSLEAPTKGPISAILNVITPISEPTNFILNTL